MITIIIKNTIFVSQLADNILITLRQRNLHGLKVDMICTNECLTCRLESSVEKNASSSTERIMSQGSHFSSLIFSRVEFRADLNPSRLKGWNSGLKCNPNIQLHSKS